MLIKKVRYEKHDDKPGFEFWESLVLGSRQSSREKFLGRDVTGRGSTAKVGSKEGDSIGMKSYNFHLPGYLSCHFAGNTLVLSWLEN